ncbi:MAG: ribonuclease H-like domain-containing protein [Bryobacterales bacterium]|nr:ribonuclease H-like domain-containing protein [Bryobacterales bacterium]
MDLQDQLQQLRRRIARIDRKYAGATTPLQSAAQDWRLPERYSIEHWFSGQEVETPQGRHFETERIWERHRRHGSIGISDLNDLPPDLFDELTGCAVDPVAPHHWAFLDTETTGLAGGSGTYAFLIGVGRITAKGFHLRQFFMRDYDEEASLLFALERYLSEFSVLVTYNGRAYDQPLLETRYRMSRRKAPFDHMRHVDLLYGARRLWKLQFESCRLVDLENQVLGVEREGDLPGEMIPYVYFEYLRRREAFRVAPIFHHNAIDILTLACLCAIVPWAFRSPAEARLRHGPEMVGIGRWLRKCGRMEDALLLFRRAVDAGLPGDLLFRTLWEVAQLERKLGRMDASVAVLTELSACRNPFRAAALEDLAKYYEHRERNYTMALEMTRAALACEDSSPLRRREQRLARRLAIPRTRRLL